MEQVAAQTLRPISRYGPSLSDRRQSVTEPTLLRETQAASLHPGVPNRETCLPETKQFNV